MLVLVSSTFFFWVLDKLFDFVYLDFILYSG